MHSFLLAGLTDALDGLMARWLKQKTTLGLYLDPIADKLLLSTLFLVLTHAGLIPRYVTVLVFSRDLGILLISTLLFATNTLLELPSQPSRETEYAGADPGAGFRAPGKALARSVAQCLDRYSPEGDRGFGACLGRAVRMDRPPPDQLPPYRRLEVFFSGFGLDLLFDGDVAKFS